MAIFKVTVDATRAIKKLNSLGKDVKTAASETVVALAEEGKRFAKSTAPHYTGKTARLIRVIKKQGANGLYAEVQSPNPTTNDGHNRPTHGAKFNLVLWMHTSANAIGHIKSGDPKYMYNMRDYLSNIKKRQAEGKFAKIATKYK